MPLLHHQIRPWNRWFALTLTNDGSQDLLICSSPQGSDWSASTHIKQKSSFGPSLTAFRQGLRAGFISSDSQKELWLTSSPTAAWWPGTKTDVRQSSDAGLALAAAPFACCCQLVPPRSSGLKGQSNYFLTGGCNPPANIVDLLVTLEVTEDIVSNDAFDLQLNAYSPIGATTDLQQFQQYVTGFNPAYTDGSGAPPRPIIGCSVEYFPSPDFNVKPQDKFSVQASAPTTLPAGYVFAIGIQCDAAGNVTAGAFRVVDNNGNLKS